MTTPANAAPPTDLYGVLNSADPEHTPKEHIYLTCNKKGEWSKVAMTHTQHQRYALFFRAHDRKYLVDQMSTDGNITTQEAKSLLTRFTDPTNGRFAKNAALAAKFAAFTAKITAVGQQVLRRAGPPAPTTHKPLQQFDVLPHIDDSISAYHAWKNALLVLANDLTKNPKFLDLLRDQDFFDNDIMSFLSLESDDPQDPTANLEIAMKKLQQPILDHPDLDLLAGTVKDHLGQISILNEEDAAVGCVCDESTLHNVADLFLAYDQPGPWDHIIISGFDGHWTTLVLRKDEDGAIHWFGSDSLGGSQGLQKHTTIIRWAFDHRASTLKVTYDVAIGKALSRTRDWLKADSTVKLPEYSAVLSKPANIISYTNCIIAGDSYLKRLQLWNDPAYTDQVDDLKLLAKYYADNLPDGDLKTRMLQVYTPA